MSLRRSLGVLAACLVLVLAHVALVRLMAEGGVAHVLLGAGNAMPPLGAALLAVTHVVVRLLAVVVVPGAALAAVASIAAHTLVGPVAVAAPSEPQRGGGSRSGAGSSVAGATGTSIGGRGTK